MKKENNNGIQIPHEDGKNNNPGYGKEMSRRKFISTATVLGTSALLGMPALLSASSRNGVINNNETHSKTKNTTTMKSHKCKITVLKREYNQELADRYLANPNVGKCPYFTEGQEFIVDNEAHFRMMNGQFCGEAWDAISRYVYTALQGGSIMRGWTNDEKMMITCCND